MVSRPLLHAAAACVLLAGACTASEGESLPPAEDAAEVFVAAWNERDAAVMTELLSDPARWPEARLRRFLARRVGVEIDFEVSLTGDVTTEGADEIGPGASPSPGATPDATARAPYSISYSAEGVADEETLEGTLDLELRGPGGWTVRWDAAAMWPGFEDATGLELSRRWPRRAPILDRDRRVLARGPAADRTYPFGSTAGSTVGHIGTLSRKDARATDLYSAGDLAGVSGLEEAFDERLAGEPGVRVDLLGGTERLDTLLRDPPEPGRAVRTTLDVRVQQAAAGAFGGTTGGAAVLDPATGDVLAVVSSAELNPELYVGARDVQPFNRALSGLYPPGSSLKVMTGAAALESGVVNLGTRLSGPREYKGVRNFESGEFGSIDFASAVRFSVNTAFAQIAEDLGAARLTRFARAFGFNSPPKMPLGAATSSFPRPADLGDLMWASIGQAQVLATPLHMATVAATIANGGKRMEPRISLHEPPSGERAVSRRTARTMTQLMEGVVEGGTGVAARIPGVRVAGKTGTAEVDVNGKRRNHAWFVAFAPANRPKLAVAVVSELGGIGGQVAAPLARAILQATLPLAS
ncbi:MAG: penicillin-binding transpeptidase domain-containing protein [Actinomycetota bacterium]|nr:penicillin-binding transpeptidase domain-containing protein [Actinomycetota bacterium]